MVVAAVGAVTAIGGAVIQSSAASKSAKAQARAAREQIQANKEALAHSEELNRPYLEAGTRALDPYQASLGLLGADKQNEAYGMFANSPDYLYALDQGMRHTLASSAVTGLGTQGGGVLRQLQKEGSGLATQNLNNWRSGLSNLWGKGSETAGYLGTQAVAGANQQNQYTQSAADARLSAYQRQANAWGGALNSLGSVATAAYGRLPPSPSSVAQISTAGLFPMVGPGSQRSVAKAQGNP